MIAKWLSLFLLMGLGAQGGCNDQKPASPPDAASGQAEADNTAADVAEADAKEKEALEAYVEAVVYGLPLVIMDITKDKMTNVAKPEDFAAPINQFVNVRGFPDASFKEVVRANVDTLYSSAFLDLSAEPKAIGIVSGETFDPSKLDPTVVNAHVLAAGASAGDYRWNLETASGEAGPVANGPASAPKRRAPCPTILSRDLPSTVRSYWREQVSGGNAMAKHCKPKSALNHEKKCKLRRYQVFINRKTRPDKFGSVFQ